VRNVVGKPFFRSPSRQTQPVGAPLRAASARARRSARSGSAPQYKSMASRGVGGTNGRPSARGRTVDGKTPGHDFVRRAIERRFLSAVSASHLDMVGPPGARLHDAIEVLKLSSLAELYGPGLQNE